MRQLLIVTILGVLLVGQGWCRPNKDFDDEEYPDDVADEPDYSVTDDEGDSIVSTGGPPQIKSKSVAIRARVGNTVQLPCLVVNADNHMVTWEKDNEYLYYDMASMTREPDRIVRLENNSLMIINANVNDTSDNYVCQILDTPVIRIVHRLQIVDRDDEPTIHVTPSEHVEITQGESVTLGCKTRVQPKPEIKWSRKGKRLPTGEETVQRDTITISKATRHHAGLYQCLADNHLENPPHAAIELIVRYPPEIQVERESVHTGTGIESELTCIVHANPQARVTWYKNEKEIVPKVGKMTMKNNKSRHILVLGHTTKHDLGKYTCKAINELGEATGTISLTGAPTQATFYEGEMSDDDTTPILKWRLESYSPITEYRLEYRRKGDTTWNYLAPRVVDGKGTQFTVEHPIEGLERGSYEAILMARNDFGWSPRSVPYTFTGEYEYKPEKADSAKGSAVRAQSLVALTLLLVVSSCVSVHL